MDNYYHLLIKTSVGNLSQIMRHINSAYTTYFSVKLDRSGYLFQGRYKSILVDMDQYAKGLSRYIHLNPVRENAVSQLCKRFGSKIEQDRQLKKTGNLKKIKMSYMET